MLMTFFLFVLNTNIPFPQGEDRQSLMFSSHFTPAKPVGQMQVKLLILSKHVPKEMPKQKSVVYVIILRYTNGMNRVLGVLRLVEPCPYQKGNKRQHQS